VINVNLVDHVLDFYFGGIQSERFHYCADFVCCDDACEDIRALTTVTSLDRIFGHTVAIRILLTAYQYAKFILV